MDKTASELPRSGNNYQDGRANDELQEPQSSSPSNSVRKSYKCEVALKIANKSQNKETLRRFRQILIQEKSNDTILGSGSRNGRSSPILSGPTHSASSSSNNQNNQHNQHNQRSILKRTTSCSSSKSVSFEAAAAAAAAAAAVVAENNKSRVHESKLYKRGVLQAINCCASVDFPARNLPLSWEESLGGPRALLGAAQDGDDELAERILAIAGKAGLGNIELNAYDSSGRTAISYMAGNGSALVLETCLALRGVDPNLPDNEGNAPLHFAAQAGQTECLNALLQRCPGIEVDARNNLGFTPLMKAALQGRTKCAKILLFAGANPTLRDHGRGLRAEQWARFCGRYVCAEVIERFARHRLLEKTTSCHWGSEPELAVQLLQGKLLPIPPAAAHQQQPPTPSSGLKSKIRRVFRTSSSSSPSFSLVSQLTSAALCASSPVLPKPNSDSTVSPVVQSLLRPLSVPQLRITLVAPQQDVLEKSNDKYEHSSGLSEKIDSTVSKPPRTKKKSK